MKKLRALFVKIPDEPYESNDLSAQVEAEFDDAIERGRKRAELVWRPVREMAMRGLSAGALAMLTLFGSQVISNTQPRVEIWWVLETFIFGLGCLLARQFVLILYSHIETRGRLAAIPDGWGGYKPPRIVCIVARAFDILAVLALIDGAVKGMIVLRSLTLPH